MKTFIVLYRSSVSSREQMSHATPEQMKEGMALWMAWSEREKAHIVDLGRPVIGGKQVDANGAEHDTHDTIGGYSILQGESLEAAVKAVHGHPHFHSPDASITILETMPIPGM
jgi:hypothetical protein